VNEHWLIVSCGLLSYLTLNVILTARLKAFALACGRKRELILYSLAFLLEGSLIVLGLGLMEFVRWLDTDSDH
jgi:hypothetical protein